MTVLGFTLTLINAVIIGILNWQVKKLEREALTKAEINSLHATDIDRRLVALKDEFVREVYK